MNCLRILCIIGIILLYVQPSFGDEGERGELEMSLHEVLTIAIANNFDVQLNLYDRWITDTDIDRARSIYDAAITLQGDYEYDKSQKPTIILGQASHTGSAEAEISKKLISGTDLSVTWENQRMSTDSAFTAINPYYESALEMKFTQPLLKNFFGMNDWGDVLITRIDVHNFSLETLDAIESDMADVEKAYWEVVVAKELVRVGEKMYTDAKKFYEINVDKKKLGTSELADLYAAEANMENRKAELLTEENALKDAINELRFLINHPDTDADIIPAETIEFGVRGSDFEDNLRVAFENRRDYKRAKNDIKARKIEFNMKRNSRWPELDFEGSLRLNGLGPVYKSSAAKSFTDANPVYGATVTFTVPFEDNLAKSEYDKARYEKEQALVTLKKTEKEIVIDTDDATRLVNLKKENAERRIRVEGLQKKKLEEEVKQYRIGRSDSDRIIRFQEDLLQATILALRALKDYKDALVDLYVTQNVYLDKRKLTVK